jgi:hypothetical protein
MPENKDRSVRGLPASVLDILAYVRTVVTTALIVILIVTFLSIVYGLIADGRLTIRYAFLPNFVVAAVLIAAGLLLPTAPNRVISKFKSRQLVEYGMFKQYMDSRAEKQLSGRRIMWYGIAVAAITGSVEIILWAITR